MKLSGALDGSVSDVMELATEHGLEGIVAKLG